MNLIPSLLSVIITFFFKLNFLQFQDFTIGLFTLSGDFISDIVSFLVQYFIIYAVLSYWFSKMKFSIDSLFFLLSINNKESLLIGFSSFCIRSSIKILAE